MAAPIFSILAVGYLVFTSSRTPRTVSAAPSNKPILPPPPLVPTVVLSVDLRGEIKELYFYKPEGALGTVSHATIIVLKVRIVNHGPDEATITEVGLQVGLGDFQRMAQVTNIPDSWHIRRRRPEFNFFPSYYDTTIAPALGSRPHKEIYKKGLPHEGWLAFECVDFRDVEFPNAQFDLLLRDSLGGGHRISRKPMLYVREGQIVVPSQPTLPSSSKED